VELAKKKRERRKAILEADKLPVLHAFGQVVFELTAFVFTERKSRGWMRGLVLSQPIENAWRSNYSVGRQEGCV
jgi:hypothetical protein